MPRNALEARAMGSRVTQEAQGRPSPPKLWLFITANFLLPELLLVAGSPHSPVFPIYHSVLSALSPPRPSYPGDTKGLMALPFSPPPQQAKPARVSLLLPMQTDGPHPGGDRKSPRHQHRGACWKGRSLGVKDSSLDSFSDSPLCASVSSSLKYPLASLLWNQMGPMMHNSSRGIHHCRVIRHCHHCDYKIHGASRPHLPLPPSSIPVQGASSGLQRWVPW